MRWEPATRMYASSVEVLEMGLFEGKVAVITGGAHGIGPDAAQQPVGRVGKPEDIAEMALFLCSEKAGFITGENICIDGGMTRLMIYHGEHGWSYE